MGLMLFGIFGITVAVVFFIQGVRMRERAVREFSELMLALADDPLDPTLQAEFLASVVQPHFRALSTAASEIAYATALSVLEAHPVATAAKTFALAVGRWHLARCRKDGIGTNTDEHVIQNDILVRCRPGKDELVTEPVA
jgi:hypothetical protein